MLVFTRRVGEAIVINDDISVTIIRVGPNDVRLGIEAPEEISVARDDAQATESSRGITEERTTNNAARTTN
jgi:carbon storage regulator